MQFFYSFLKFLSRILNSRKIFFLLIFMNLVIGITVFILNRNTLGGDYHSYNNLAEGILTGNYSMYYFMSDSIPDTFRNPGYPLFLAFLKLFSSSVLLVQVVQLLAYFFTIYLTLKICSHYFNSLILKNLFLILLLISINIVIFTPYYLTEILCAFLITLSLWLDIKISNSKTSKFILLGLLYGYIFQVRPIFLFFPFIKFCFDWIVNKSNFELFKNSLLIVVYLITMIPFGLWNYNHHGVFKITSLAGGAEVMNAGYWAQKIPDYTEDRSFGNTFFEEPILFIRPEERESNILKFNKEWDYIDSSCAKYLTKNDRIQDSLKHKENNPLPMNFSSRYTIEREKVIMEVTKKDMFNDKVYVIKSKIYSAFRLWITGIQMNKFRQSSIAGKLTSVAPTLLTGFIFILSLIFIPIAFFKFKLLFNQLYSFLLIVIYYGLIHVPFVIQSRYTVPVRMLLLMILAASIYHLFFKHIEEQNLKS